MAPPLANLINISVTKSNFPMDLKKSELSPPYTCKDSLMCENYRPLSVLTSLSKIFEKVFTQQLYDYFTDVMFDLLSAFRKKYGCHHVLTKLIEDSKQALDRHMNAALLLLDLSKVFDWLHTDCCYVNYMPMVFLAILVRCYFLIQVIDYREWKYHPLKVNGSKWRRVFHKDRF